MRDYLAAGMDGNLSSAERFDVVFLDPPTFSNSKKMKGFLDIQRDHARLIEGAMARLVPGGVLYFSTNKRVFILDSYLAKRYFVEDISDATIPEDFRDRKIHRAFKITHKI
jgi:23S rRNA (cytosine1962-C5)-methyltransferase